MGRKQQSLVDGAWTSLLVIFTGLSRLVPHPWNMTPMGAVGIFGGSRLPLALALALPLGIMVVTDSILWATMNWPPFNPVVYASLLGYAVLGAVFLRKVTFVRIVGVSLLGSLQFFLITNFAIWCSASLPVADLGGASHAWMPSNNEAYPLVLRYSADLAGLLACYAMALPFYGGTLAGDLIYPLALFGLHRVFIAPVREEEFILSRRPETVR